MSAPAVTPPGPLGHRLARPVAIHDPADPRLADYRLTDPTAARRTHRDDAAFIAEGFVAIRQVLASGHRLRSVLLMPARLARFEAEVLGRPAPVPRGAQATEPVPIYLVEREVLAATVGFDLHRGVLASAARRPPTTLAGLARSTSRLAALEGLNDPENVGLIARAARAFGVGGLVLDATCTDPYARRSVRVSMGEILHLPWTRATSWPDQLEELHAFGVETWAMTPAADAEDLWTITPPERVAVILGAEAPGLASDTMARATRRVRIPIRTDVDSLNVGHAAAITFAALARPAVHPMKGPVEATSPRTCSTWT